MDIDIDEQAEILAKKARHFLITNMGRHPKQAFPWEVFQAVSFVLREQVMVNWAATIQTVNRKGMRRLYYLSMEYLPGRMLVNNISNLHIHPLMHRVVEKLGYEYKDILALEPDPGLGNGGLGRLASCFLDSLATHKYPVIAYGLRYQYGIFEQQLWEGVQVEKPDCWLLNENPWNLRHDGSAKTVKYSGIVHKRMNGNDELVYDLTDYEEVRALPFDFPVIGYSFASDFNVATLRLWSTKESPRNFLLQRYNAGQIGPAAENTALTDVLYPNDNHEIGKRIRLKQEFLLVSASLQDIIQRHLENYPSLENFADVVRIQINDTHPALVIPELMRILTQVHEISWAKAWEMTQEIVGFTNHTILPESLEQWNQDRLYSLLPRQYKIIEQINQQLMDFVRSGNPQDQDVYERMTILHGDQVRMANLAIYGSHKINGVARLHGDILKRRVFKDFYAFFPDKFTYVTNGVTQRHWLWHCNTKLSYFLIDRIGMGWITDFSEIEKIRDFASDPESQKAFLRIKKQNKEQLLVYLRENNPIRDHFGKVVSETYDFDTDAMFTVQVKRVHEYKRQMMNALHLIMLYQELLEDPNSHSIKRVAIVAGKAAAGYQVAKDIIHLLYCLARKINADPAIQDKLKVVFVENYCVTRAEKIIPAADLSEQISTAGMEASGTGNMKLAINGALTIGTEDGANIEMREAIKDPWWPFSFGARADELQALYSQNQYNPWDIYSKYPKIKRAIDALKDGTFTQCESEEASFSYLFDIIMLGYGNERPDRYFVLYDLPAYHETQKLVEQYYLDPAKWAEVAIHNIAGMGTFSTDTSIQKYAQNIWGLNPCPIDPEILKGVRRVYEESTLKA